MDAVVVCCTHGARQRRRRGQHDDHRPPRHVIGVRGVSSGRAPSADRPNNRLRATPRTGARLVIASRTPMSGVPAAMTGWSATTTDHHHRPPPLTTSHLPPGSAAKLRYHQLATGPQPTDHLRTRGCRRRRRGGAGSASRARSPQAAGGWWAFTARRRHLFRIRRGRCPFTVQRPSKTGDRPSRKAATASRVS